jgi:hypothetical protein
MRIEADPADYLTPRRPLSFWDTSGRFFAFNDDHLGANTCCLARGPRFSTSRPSSVTL